MKLLIEDVILNRFREAETIEDDDGNKIKEIYLMNTLDCPSHKFYTPFAHSNVGQCKCCKGTGEIRNKHAKKKKFEYLKKKFMRMWTTSDDDPSKVIKIRKQANHWEPMISCPECHGIGSLEARLDEDFWNQIDDDLSEIGAWRTSSEGNVLDVMAQIAVDDNAVDDVIDGDREDV
jgi:hypothetical protein